MPDPQPSPDPQPAPAQQQGGFFAFMSDLMPFLNQAVPLGLTTYGALTDPKKYMQDQTDIQKAQIVAQQQQQKQQLYIFGGVIGLMFIMILVFIFAKK